MELTLFRNPDYTIKYKEKLKFLMTNLIICDCIIAIVTIGTYFQKLFFKVLSPVSPPNAKDAETL